MRLMPTTENARAMSAIAINATWTALRDKLVFEFTPYRGEEQGASTVRVFFTGDRERRVHEIGLASEQQRDFSYLFNCASDGEVYVRGTLRRALHRQGDGIVHLGVFADIVYGHLHVPDEQHFEGAMLFVEAHARPPEPSPPMPLPELDEPEPAAQAIVCAAHGDLFSRIPVGTGPDLGAAASRLRCIRYLPVVADSPGNTLYDALVAARRAGRDAMEALVLRHIAGDNGSLAQLFRAERRPRP